MSPIPLARPSREFVTVKTWTLTSFFELVHLRTNLADAITPLDADLSPRAARVARGMVLVSNELASNALGHSFSPTTLTLKADDTHYLLQVTDYDPDASPIVHRGHLPGEEGFGLVLARKVATDMGWYAEDLTKNVWATFPIREHRTSSTTHC